MLSFTGQGTFTTRSRTLLELYGLLTQITGSGNGLSPGDHLRLMASQFKDIVNHPQHAQK